MLLYTPMNAFTIKDLENLTGIKAHTIRIWEQRYSFLKPQRTDTNIRYYSNEELKKILNVALLNKYGFKISHIDKMSDEEMIEKIHGINGQEAGLERLLNAMIQCMVDMDLEGFERLINEYIVQKGIERAIEQVIFPFLERIGVLWMTGHINPAQEHLVSNLIRQKMIVGIDSIKPTYHADKSCVLFLPEGEYHELGLLFVHYLMRSEGIAVSYLGTNVPFKDIEYVINIKKPDFIYTHLTSVSNAFSFDRFIQQTIKRFASTPMIISGRMASTYESKIPPHIHFKRSLKEVMEFIRGAVE